MEIQIKRTLRFSITPVTMVVIFKNEDKCWCGCKERGTFIHSQEDYILLQPHWKSVCSFHRKLDIDVQHNPATLLLHTCSKDFMSNFRDMCSSVFICVLFTKIEIINSLDTHQLIIKMQ